MSRRVQRTRKPEESSVNLTPMLDVVFILLIFFLVTASFVKETAIDVPKPAVPTTRPPDIDKVESILVEIDAAGAVTIDGRPTDWRRLRVAITGKLAADQPLPVLIRTAPEATNGIFVRVLDQARLTGAPIRLIGPSR